MGSMPTSTANSIGLVEIVVNNFNDMVCLTLRSNVVSLANCLARRRRPVNITNFVGIQGVVSEFFAFNHFHFRELIFV